MKSEAKQGFQAILDGLPEALISLDEHWRFTFVNRKAAELLGASAKRLKGVSILDAFPKVQGTEWFRNLAAAMSENIHLRFEALSPFNEDWVELHAHPLKGGGIVVRFHVLKDLPDYMDEEAEEADDKNMLLEEVIHRVKNNFQMIISLLDLQYIQASSAEARAIISDTRDRVQAVALAHKKLCELPTHRDIELGEYLEELTRILDSTYCPANTNITLKFDFDRIQIDSNRAMTCGLLVNEAVTNCLKHAFENCKSGEIEVTLKRESDSDIVLSICDNGGGIPTEKLHCEPPSLGLRLMRLLAGQLHGQIDWNSSSSGTTVTLRFREHS